MPDPVPDLLVSIHVAKTGGNTFATILERAATGMYCQFYGPDHAETRLALEGVTVAPIDRGLTAEGEAELPPGTDTLSLFDRLLTVPSIGARRNVLHGHLGTNRMLERYPTAEFAVWLRDPIERLISHFEFWRRLVVDVDDVEAVAALDAKRSDSTRDLLRRVRDDEVTIEEFAEMPAVRNAQTWTTGRRSLDTFAFVGITEQYDRGLDLFGRMYDVDTSDVVELNVNPDQRERDRYDIPAGTRKTLESINRADLELYQEAVERFELLDATTARPRRRRRLRSKLGGLARRLR